MLKTPLRCRRRIALRSDGCLQVRLLCTKLHEVGNAESRVWRCPTWLGCHRHQGSPRRADLALCLVREISILWSQAIEVLLDVLGRHLPRYLTRALVARN
eukprot:7290324-Pyramimonas_sp.AAC.1